MSVEDFIENMVKQKGESFRNSYEKVSRWEWSKDKELYEVKFNGSYEKFSRWGWSKDEELYEIKFKENSYGLYNATGENVYGGPHFWIRGLENDGNGNYLVVIPGKKQDWRLYKRDGTVVKEWGGPHHEINNFILIGGEPYLSANDLSMTPFRFTAPLTYYYSREGVGFEETEQALWFNQFKRDLNGFGLTDQLCGTLNKLNSFLFAENYAQKIAVYDAIGRTIKKIIGNCYGDDEKARSELERALTSLERAIGRNPEKFIKELATMAK